MATRDSENTEISLETDFISAPDNNDETVQTIALGLCDYQKNVTPNPSTEEFVRQEDRDREELYQSAGHDSGTDSAEEETSPFGSPGNEKLEACAPSGQKITEQKRTVRDSGETVDKEPRSEVNAIMRNEQALGYELFQCSGVRKTSESDSDSGKEEKTSRTETRNVMAITGKATDAIAPPPVFPPSITGKGRINTSIPVQSLTNNSANNDTRLTDEQFDLWKNFVAFGWPHTSPSAKAMAVAGFRYLGSYDVKDSSRTRTVHDLVECCRCGKTLHSFEHGDDPRQEHLKLHGHCP